MVGFVGAATSQMMAPMAEEVAAAMAGFGGCCGCGRQQGRSGVAATMAGFGGGGGRELDGSVDGPGGCRGDGGLDGGCCFCG